VIGRVIKAWTFGTDAAAAAASGSSSTSSSSSASSSRREPPTVPFLVKNGIFATWRDMLCLFFVLKTSTFKLLVVHEPRVQSSLIKLLAVS